MLMWICQYIHTYKRFIVHVYLDLSQGDLSTTFAKYPDLLEPPHA